MSCGEPLPALHLISELLCNDNRIACTTNADVLTLHRLCFYGCSRILDNP
ncbi:hypothetical protein Barb7_02761 [Bacteroidales bacterium Barb7]|nr:hypothetical protein Barb7_02761 [Bacteroidales bacterium Barb7]